jgi:hypothetical protein
MRLVWIHYETGFGVATVAIETISAGNIERQHHTVAFLDAANRIADFFDHAHNLVADHSSLFERSSAVVHVQITAADASGGNS